MELIQARQSATELALPKEIEWVGLDEALGRVLGGAISASHDVPGEDRSRLDGFALRSSDTLRALPREPVALRVLPALLAAGHTSDLEIRGGECVRILTGAPVPPGADAVVPQEKSTLDGAYLLLRDPLSPGQGIAGSGEEIRRGDVVLSGSEVLTPTRLAVIAALGHASIPVYRKPRVALLATGDEVRELGQPMKGPWTFCNNRLLLGWLVRLQGGEPVHLGIEVDDAGSIARRLEDVDADMIITTGGIGRGDRDCILRAWEELRVKTVFRSINLSPGKNTAMGVRGEQLFWAFPGNPWAGQLVFEELTAPTMRRCQGLKQLRSTAVAARLGASLKKTSGMYKAVRGVLDTRTDPPSFIPAGGKRRSVSSMVKNSFAYTVLGSHVEEVPEGSVIEVHLHDFPLLAYPLFNPVESCVQGSNLYS